MLSLLLLGLQQVYNNTQHRGQLILLFVCLRPVRKELGSVWLLEIQCFHTSGCPLLYRCFRMSVVLQPDQNLC